MKWRYALVVERRVEDIGAAQSKNGDIGAVKNHNRNCVADLFCISTSDEYWSL